jgi:hypothetical protein
MVIVEKLVERRLAGETEVLGETLPQRHFVHHKFHMTRPGRLGGKQATNSLSYGAAFCHRLKNQIQSLQNLKILSSLA